VQLEEVQITHESDVGGDFTIPSMDAEASGSRTSELSSHSDENVVQDTHRKGVTEEASEPHALRKSSPGVQNLKTGPHALGTAENESGSVKHEKGTRRPQYRRKRVRERKT
jgi:hypothetical protein